MSIQSNVMPHLQLTVHTAQGELTFAELMETLKTFYANQPTVKVLWELRGATLTNLTADQVRTAVHFATQRGHLRSGGKTALLVSDRLGDYGIGRMAEIMSHVERATVTLEVFRDYDEAFQWLQIESD
jgi:hypothetical protein